MEAPVLMPGKLSRTWRSLCQRVMRQGPAALDDAKAGYYIWLLKQYGREAVMRHAHRIERAMDSIYREVQQEQQRQRSGGLEL